MSILRAFFRLLLAATMLTIGMTLTLLFMLVPIRMGNGMRLAAWPISWMAHIFLWTFNIQYRCENPAMLRQHQGLVFCNHLSYVDPIIPFAIAPLRFLGAAGVRRLPVINWIALALDTIYVNRSDQTSRSQARQEIASQLQERPYPPLMLYPEGNVGPGDALLEFRHGAFEIALEYDIPCLLCAIQYDPLPVVAYYKADDTLPKAIWRLATHGGPVYAELKVLSVLDIPALDTTDRSAQELAESAHEIISSACR